MAWKIYVKGGTSLAEICVFFFISVSIIFDIPIKKRVELLFDFLCQLLIFPLSSRKKIIFYLSANWYCQCYFVSANFQDYLWFLTKDSQIAVIDLSATNLINLNWIIQRIFWDILLGFFKNSSIIMHIQWTLQFFFLLHLTIFNWVLTVLDNFQSIY